MSAASVQFREKRDYQDRRAYLVECAGCVLGTIERDPDNRRKWLAYVGNALPVQCCNLDAARALFELDAALAEIADGLRATAAGLRMWYHQNHRQVRGIPEPLAVEPVHPSHAANRLEKYADRISKRRSE
jgi:hypothetical protein